MGGGGGGGGVVSKSRSLRAEKMFTLSISYSNLKNDMFSGKAGILLDKE